MFGGLYPAARAVGCVFVVEPSVIALEVSVAGSAGQEVVECVSGQTELPGAFQSSCLEIQGMIAPVSWESFLPPVPIVSVSGLSDLSFRAGIGRGYAWVVHQHLRPFLC